MKFATRIAPVTLALSFGAAQIWAMAAATTPAGIDRDARPFEARAAAHKPDAIFANFAGDGTHYVRYASEKTFAKELAAFLDGTAPGGGSFVARTYHVAGSRGLYVTFDPGVQNSTTERERVLFDALGNAVRLHEEFTSYNAYYRTVRDAYFVRGKAIVDRTTRFDYSPSDQTFAHPLKKSKAILSEMTLPAYETRAKLPFPA